MFALCCGEWGETCVRLSLMIVIIVTSVCSQIAFVCLLMVFHHSDIFPLHLVFRFLVSSIEPQYSIYLKKLVSWQFAEYILMLCSNLRTNILTCGGMHFKLASVCCRKVFFSLSLSLYRRITRLRNVKTMFIFSAPNEIGWISILRCRLWQPIRTHSHTRWITTKCTTPQRPNPKTDAHRGQV